MVNARVAGRWFERFQTDKRSTERKTEVFEPVVELRVEWCWRDVFRAKGG